MKDEITMKIESSVKGHETVTLPMMEAVERVESETKDHGKWLYADGRYISVDSTTKEGLERLQNALTNASNITLAGRLLGG